MSKVKISDTLRDKKRKSILKEVEKAKGLLVDAFKALEKADQEALSIPDYGTSGSVKDFQRTISTMLSTDHDEAGLQSFIRILKAELK